MVTRSGALVQELKERVPLAGVSSEPSVPAVHLDRGVDRGVAIGVSLAVDHRRQGRAQTLEQVDQVVERHPLTPVGGGRPVGVLPGGRGIAGRDREGEPVREQRGIVEPFAQTEPRRSGSSSSGRARRPPPGRVRRACPWQRGYVRQRSVNRRTGREAVGPGWGDSRPESSVRPMPPSSVRWFAATMGLAVRWLR